MADSQCSSLSYAEVKGGSKLWSRWTFLSAGEQVRASAQMSTSSFGMDLQTPKSEQCKLVTLDLTGQALLLHA
jgi:hypothetical protein